VTLSTAFPFISSAESLDSIKQKEEQTQAVSKTLGATLDSALTEANKKYQEIEVLREDISKAQDNLKKYQSEITTTQETIDNRKEAVASQMKNLQVSSTADRTIEVLLTSGSVSEFINRSVALNTLRQAQNEKISSLASEKEKLVLLKEKQAATTVELEENIQSLDAEASQLEERVSNVRSQMEANKAELAKLANSREAEEKRQADEQAAAAAKTVATPTNNDSQASGENSSAPSTSAPTPAPPVTEGGGRVLNMQSTAYSIEEPGMGNITALGIDLRQNPNVIAVDPGVIPLGTLVEVSGYGFAIAGDTGGAIRGNIIDCHFSTVAQCIQWGRRTVSVKLLS
jgi:3D (Asp-Asp-Asp) domain-containing protein/predicted  nucleic acid-binding Zn-ribbon protein